MKLMNIDKSFNAFIKLLGDDTKFNLLSELVYRRNYLIDVEILEDYFLKNNLTISYNVKALFNNLISTGLTKDFITDEILINIERFGVTKEDKNNIEKYLRSIK